MNAERAEHEFLDGADHVVDPLAHGGRGALVFLDRVGAELFSGQAFAHGVAGALGILDTLASSLEELASLAGRLAELTMQAGQAALQIAPALAAHQRLAASVEHFVQQHRHGGLWRQVLGDQVHGAVWHGDGLGAWEGFARQRLHGVVQHDAPAVDQAINRLAKLAVGQAGANALDLARGGGGAVAQAHALHAQDWALVLRVVVRGHWRGYRLDARHVLKHGVVVVGDPAVCGFAQGHHRHHWLTVDSDAAAQVVIAHDVAVIAFRLGAAQVRSIANHLAEVAHGQHFSRVVAGRSALGDAGPVEGDRPDRRVRHGCRAVRQHVGEGFGANFGQWPGSQIRRDVQVERFGFDQRSQAIRLNAELGAVDVGIEAAVGVNALLGLVQVLGPNEIAVALLEGERVDFLGFVLGKTGADHAAQNLALAGGVLDQHLFRLRLARWLTGRKAQVFDAIEQLVDVIGAGQVDVALLDAFGVFRVGVLLEHHNMGIHCGAGALERRWRHLDVGDHVQIGRLFAGQVRLEALICQATTRDQRNDTAAVAQVFCCLADVLDRRLAAAAIRRVHDDRVVLVRDVQIFKAVVDDTGVAIGKRCTLRQLVARLDHGHVSVLREEPGNGAMACRRLEHLVALLDVSPLSHLEAKRLRRGEVVGAFALVAALRVLLLCVIERLGLGEAGQLHACRHLPVIGLAAFAVFSAGRCHVGIHVGVDEGLLQAAGVRAKRQVLGRRRTLGDLAGECAGFPCGAGGQVAEWRVAGLAGAIGAPLDLDGSHWLARHAQVDQHAHVLAAGVVQAHAFASGIRLEHDQFVVASIVVEGVGILPALLLRHGAVEEQGVRKGSRQGVDRRAQAIQVQLEQVRSCAEGFTRQVPGFFVRHAGRGERVKAAAFVVVVEDYDLATELHVILDHRHNGASLDRLQQVHALLIVEVAHNRVVNLAVFAVVFFAQVLQALVDLLAHGIVDHRKLAVIVERNLEPTAGQCAGSLEPLVEILLHQLGVDAGLWLGQLVVAHPVAEVLHDEAIASAAAVVPAALAFGLLQVSRVRVVEQVALGVVDVFHVRERGRRQEQGFRQAFLFRPALIPCLARRLLDGVPLGLCVFDGLVESGLILFGIVQHLLRRWPGSDRRLERSIGFRVLVAHGLVEAGVMPGNGAKLIQGASRFASLVARQVVRLVGDRQIPVTSGQAVVRREVGVGGDDRAFAAIVLGAFQGLQVDTHHAGELHPVRCDLVARHHDDDVVFAVVDEALRQAQAAGGLASARAVGVHHAVAGLKALLGLEHVVALLRQQQRKRCVDAGLVGALGLGAVGLLLCG
ncbi:hypothetical protein D3C87_1061200 [compost metagenome]